MSAMPHYKAIIVGAGASGLNSAKQLIHDEGIDPREVLVLDDTEIPGGVWNRSGGRTLPPSLLGGACEYSACPIPDELNTNLPTHVMAFSDLKYPPHVEAYPSHVEVQRYLERYRSTFVPADCCQYNTTVVSVQKDGDKWQVVGSVKTSDCDKSNAVSCTADNVIICSGHFRHPYVPKLTGLTMAASGIRCLHSSAFRNSSDFNSSRKILIVGSRASGIDIASQLLKHRARNHTDLRIIMSVRNLGSLSFVKSRMMRGIISLGVELKDDILSFDDVGCTVTFTDGSVEENVDTIIYATGYRYVYPFLNLGGCCDSVGAADSADGSLGGLKGGPLPMLHNFVVYASDPTLFFIGTPRLLISPAIIIEYQNRYVAQIISGKIPRPPVLSTEQLKALTAEERKEYDLSCEFGLIKCITYCNKLASYTGTRGYISQLVYPRVLLWMIEGVVCRLLCRLVAAAWPSSYRKKM